MMLQSGGQKALVEQLCAEELHFARLKEPSEQDPPEMFGMSVVADPCTWQRMTVHARAPSPNRCLLSPLLPLFLFLFFSLLLFLSAFGGRMILFGGADSTGGKFSSDIWILSLADKSWTRVKPASQIIPSGRHFHSCVLFERSLWVFGGSSNGIYQDVFKFNLDSGCWTVVSTNGYVPSPRYGHSAVVYNDCMYIYGGFDGNGFACNDVCAFSFATLSWDKPVLAGAAQEAFHHSAVVYQGSMYTFGGYRKTYNEIQEYRFATKSWSFLQTSGSAPKPRWGHAAVVSGHYMYVFGGRDRVSNFQDLHSFNFETRTWRKIEFPPHG